MANPSTTVARGSGERKAVAQKVSLRVSRGGESASTIRDEALLESLAAMKHLAEQIRRRIATGDAIARAHFAHRAALIDDLQRIETAYLPEIARGIAAMEAASRQTSRRARSAAA